jgi:hypothetical protein
MYIHPYNNDPIYCRLYMQSQINTTGTGDYNVEKILLSTWTNNILIILWNGNFNSWNLRIYVTQKGANVELPDDDMEMSKHVEVWIT